MNLFSDLFKTFFSDEGNRQREFKESYSGNIVTEDLPTQKIRITKTDLILKHLNEKGSIDSWTAIQQFGATRLSSIIYNLRKRGYDIISIPNSVLDRNNNVCNFTNYQLLKK
jgi:hypothetical protein